MKLLSWFALYLSFGKNWLKTSCIILKTYQIHLISWIANSKNPQVHTYLKEVNTRNQNIVLHTSNNLDSMANLKKVVVCFVLLRSGIDCKPHRIHPNIANTSQVWKSRSLKVVGGSDSNNHEFPWMVALVYDYSRLNPTFQQMETESFIECGGSLISPNLVLTAAHCIKSELKSVKLGHANLMSEDVIEVDVASTIIHPDWDRKMNDIALIMLTERVEFNNNVHPISLPRGNIKKKIT